MDLMIDIETLGKIETAPVLSIGATFFNVDGLVDNFYAELMVQEQFDLGRVPCASTIDWWIQQEDAAKKFNNKRPVEDVLNEFFTFCTLHRDPIPWGNGSTFDISILENLFRMYGYDVPWKFYKVRDLRTFKEYVDDGEGIERVGTYHNALDDAITQALVVIRGKQTQRRNRLVEAISQNY